MTVITLLTQQDCHWCDQSKKILARLSDEHAVRVEEISMDTDEGRALALLHGVVFAPGVLLDGQLVSFGRPSEKKLRRRLSAA